MDIKDQMINTAVVNLFTLSKKDNNELNLYNFDRTQKRHLAMLRIASIVRDLTGCDVKINTSLFNYFLIKRKLKMKWLKRTKKKSIDIEKEAKHIEEAYKFESDFVEIYQEYYADLNK